MLVLGFCIPDESIQKDLENDLYPAVQTHKFNWSFVKVLELMDRFKFDYISNRPISTYPYNKRKLVMGQLHKIKLNQREIFINEAAFINLPGLKLLSRLFFTLKVVLNAVKQCKYDGVIVYSVHLPYLMIGFLLKKFFNFEIIALWTDPPAEHKSKSFLIKFIRKIEYQLSTFFMRKFDKSIVVSKYLALDFNKGTPYFVLEGISDDSKISTSRNNKKLCNTIKLVYAGSLEERYGLMRLIEAISYFDDDFVSLNLYGFGTLVPELISKKFKNVIYHGKINSEDVHSVLVHADFLINCRCDDDGFTKYSFPSKTIEYLASGTPTIINMLKGIPDEYGDYVTIVTGCEPQDIYDAISNAIVNYEACVLNADNGLEFIKNKSSYVWSKKLDSFL